MKEYIISKFVQGYKIIANKSYILKLNRDELNLVKVCKKYNFGTTTEYNLLQFFNSYKKIYKNQVQGSFVECGVWKGIYLVFIQKLNEYYNLNNRKIYGYDTFEGNPRPLEKNDDINVDKYGNSLIKEYDYKKMDDNTSGWNNASLDNVQENFNQNTQPNNNLILIKGKVEDTLLDQKNLPEKIAILKLDTNFYESFKIELEILAPKVQKNGIIIIDNYYSYKGIQKATDEYLQKNKLKVEFNRISRNAIIYI